MIDGKGKPGIGSRLRLKLTYVNVKKKHHGTEEGANDRERPTIQFCSEFKLGECLGGTRPSPMTPTPPTTRKLTWRRSFIEMAP